MQLSLWAYYPPLLSRKVLDGIPIEVAEQAAAKSKYSGRLTRDFLEERLGHGMFDRIRDMDCSTLKVWTVPHSRYGLFLNQCMLGKERDRKSMLQQK